MSQHPRAPRLTATICEATTRAGRPCRARRLVGPFVYCGVHHLRERRRATRDSRFWIIGGADCPRPGYLRRAS